MKFNNVSDLVSFVATSKKLPEWQRELFSQYADEIQVHSNGELFYKIDRLFPNESPLSKDHRILSFEAITKGSFWKGVNNVVRIFQSSSYSIEASDKTVQYITQNNFSRQNLFSYFLEKWCSNALANDANGRIAVYPQEFIMDKKFSQVTFVPSKNIEYIDDDTVIFVSEDESEKRYETTTGRVTKTVFDQSINALNIVELADKNTLAKKITVSYSRKVYHVFTDEAFYKIEQDKEDTTQYTYEYYPFKNKGFMPCFSVGGMEVGKDVYQSFFSVFCPFGNLALLQHSQHTAVNFMFSFPRMSEIETPCSAFGCDGKGYIVVPISETCPDGKEKCRTCDGTGYSTNQSPFKVYKRRFEPDKFDNGTISALDFDDVKYYTPDTSILDYSKNEWKDYLDMAEQTVYVSQKIQTGNVESAKSKEFDRDDRYNFLSKIAKVFYDRLRMTIQAFENDINSNPDEVSVDIPFSLAIESEMDTFQALQTILTSDAPVMIKANKVETFINKFVSQASPVRRFFNVLRKVDLLMFYTDSQIASQKIGGVVTATQWAYHVYAFPVLSRMFYEDRSIFDLEDAEVIAKLEAEMASVMPDENMLKKALLDKFNAA